MTDRPLTHKQDLFCRAYIANGGNATKAALEAGYSPKTAAQIGKENLQKPLIKALIKELNAPVVEKLGITADGLAQRLNEIASGRIDQVMDLTVVDLVKNDDGVYEDAEPVLTLKPFSELGPKELGLIKSVRQTRNAAGVLTTNIELHDPLAAIAQLAKFTGGFDKGDKPPLVLNTGGGALNLKVASVEEIEVMIGEARAQKKRQEGEG